ncbi:MAG: hypothetical protein FD146_685 [Anaerolineaceae bacterium]|nr:MAG: hypothetical protein FD146_685 [Anaerolineaceae bacterium]
MFARADTQVCPYITAIPREPFNQQMILSAASAQSADDYGVSRIAPVSEMCSTQAWMLSLSQTDPLKPASLPMYP